MDSNDFKLCKWILDHPDVNVILSTPDDGLPSTYIKMELTMPQERLQCKILLDVSDVEEFESRHDVIITTLDHMYETLLTLGGRRFETITTKKEDHDNMPIYNDYSDALYIERMVEHTRAFSRVDVARIDCAINGKRVFIILSKWDGNVEGIMRAIASRCGYMERHLYQQVKAYVQIIKKNYYSKRSESDTNTVPTLRPAKIIFKNPATIIYWEDGTKTVTVAQNGDIFDEEKGLAIAISKKALGNNYAAGGRFKKYLNNAERR